MDTYTPSDDAKKAMIAALQSTVPYIAGLAIKAVPDSFKDRGAGFALAHAVPLALGSIAVAHGRDSRIPLTRHGTLTEEAKQGIIKRIALWFVPDELKTLTQAITADIVRLAENGYATDSVRLVIDNKEVVLVVVNASLIRQSADTAVDFFFASSEKLMAVKDAIAGYLPSR